MNRLPKQKRTQLMGLAALTVVSLAAIYFFLVSAQTAHIAKLSERKGNARAQLAKVSAALKSEKTVKERLEQATTKLSAIEERMPSGDIYAWAITTIRDFKGPYNIDIPQFSQIEGPKNVNMLPQFPYKQASLAVGGTATYHDLGKFLADVENQFPYMRLLNLTVEPAPATSPGDAGKLTFRMDVVTLVKPLKS